MSSTGEDWRAERENKLRSAITGAIEYFRAKYDPLTRDEVAWSHAVTEWLPLWRAWADGGPSDTPAPVPSLGAPTGAATVVEAEPSGEELQEKHWEWRRLWARTQGFLAAFQSEQAKATGDDRAWSERVIKDVRMLLATSLRELVLVHPGMRRVDDIDGAEIARALYSLGEYADDDEFDDEEDDEDSDEDGLAGPEHPLS
jgi:hypothetical protein